MNQLKWILKTGERVSFTIKRDDQLHKMEGTVRQIMSSREAKEKGVIVSKKTGKVLGIEADDGQMYYKYKSVCRQTSGASK